MLIWGKGGSKPTERLRCKRGGEIWANIEMKPPKESRTRGGENGEKLTTFAVSQGHRTCAATGGPLKNVEGTRDQKGDKPCSGHMNLRRASSSASLSPSSQTDYEVAIKADMCRLGGKQDADSCMQKGMTLQKIGLSLTKG